MMATVKKLVIPKQHGAWAMLVIPFLLGAYIGGFSWIHIPLFIGWLCLYLATYPLLMAMKNKRKPFYIKWFALYFAAAAVILLFPLIYRWEIIYFGMAMTPFFLINIYYGKKKKDRAFFNDLAAIAVFCIGGLASSFIVSGEITKEAFITIMLCFLFFVGSTFYVKTMIREKNNPNYKWLSWGFHVFLMIGLVATEYAVFIIAYIPSVIRAVYFYGKKMPILKIGLIEVGNAVYFCFAMFMIINLFMLP